MDLKAREQEIFDKIDSLLKRVPLDPGTSPEAEIINTMLQVMMMLNNRCTALEIEIFKLKAK